MSDFNFYLNQGLKKPGQGADLSVLNNEVAKKVGDFHKSFREYQVTPLIDLKGLAAEFGLGRVWVKDESYRFGLNAFKVLGGAYAIGKYLADKLGLDISQVSREMLASSEVKAKIGQITFASTTDGNHGRGVAWTAQQLGQKAIIYMPKGSAQIRVDNILATGAECYVTDMNYDDTVRMTDAKAKENGWVVVQDTAWEGYTEIPTWIMQGYMTLAVEALEQIKQTGGERPTHLFLQAGVGSFAGAALGYLAAALGENCPITTIVEPKKASCIYKSAVAADGRAHTVGGEMNTIMAGLACGEPSIISWGILRDYATAYVEMNDFYAANGMRILAAPQKGDTPVVSGESGAATMGALQHIARNPNALALKKALKLDENSKVLIISTEGDTAPEIYRDIVWYGKFPDGAPEL
ncbi:diaminopropionate ammonia-lyase [Deltaproteobacteria bacterium OttesenSCG-928-M10]|nr:diaminopropionate ammonia-lyase [Deltaproteobacteria bacterium OttesenSCG-928-M10]